MQKDPFMILGVTDSVSQNELYDAYKNARKEWESKRFAPGDEGAYACERLDEIEDAYRDCCDILKGREVVETEIIEPTPQEDFVAIDELIKSKNYEGAQSKLDDIKIRGAEWHFLQSIIFHATQRPQEAYEHLRTASVIEPDNQKYSEALKRMQEKMGKPQTQGFYAYRESGDDYHENRRSYRDDGYDRRDRGMSPCDCCQGLICADCCCECMGGDLISCC